MINNNDKYSILINIYAGYFIYCFHKKCFMQLLTNIIDEFHFSEQDAGYISSAQHLSILWSTFFGGILTDYISASWLFPSGLILSGILTLLLPFGYNVNSFALIQFFDGFGHGLKLPTALRLTKDYSSPDRFATNWSFVMTSVNLAGIVAPILSTLICNYLAWRTTIHFSGLISFGLGVFLFYQLNHNSSQINFVQQQQTKKIAEKPNNQGTNIVKLILGSPLIWLVLLNRLFASFGKLSLQDWIPLYFANHAQLDPYSASLFITVFEGSGIFGKILSGRINDYLMKKYLLKLKNTDHQRTNILTPGMTMKIRLPIVIIFHIITIISLILYCNLIHSNVSILTIILVAFLSGTTMSGNVIALSVWSTEISEKKYQGLVTSLSNFANKAGAFASGYPFTLMAYWFGWYTSYTIITIMLSIIIFIDFLFTIGHFKEKID